MLKNLLVATTAFTLISGACLAESTTTTKTLNVGPLGMSTTVHDSDQSNGTVIEKERTMREGMVRHDDDVVQKDRTVTKSTDVAPNGDVTHSRSETTTVR